MRYTDHSVMSMTPASGVVRFSSDGEVWEEQLIGWAVTTYTSLEDPSAGAEGYVEQLIEPVVLSDDSAYPQVMYWYLQDFSDPKPKYKIILSHQLAEEALRDIL